LVGSLAVYGACGMVANEGYNFREKGENKSMHSSPSSGTAASLALEDLLIWTVRNAMRRLVALNLLLKPHGLREPR